MTVVLFEVFIQPPSSSTILLLITLSLSPIQCSKYAVLNVSAFALSEVHSLPLYVIVLPLYVIVLPDFVVRLPLTTVRPVLGPCCLPHDVDCFSSMIVLPDLFCPVATDNRQTFMGPCYLPHDVDCFSSMIFSLTSFVQDCCRCSDLFLHTINSIVSRLLPLF